MCENGLIALHFVGKYRKIGAFDISRTLFDMGRSERIWIKAVWRWANTIGCHQLSFLNHLPFSIGTSQVCVLNLQELSVRNKTETTQHKLTYSEWWWWRIWSVARPYLGVTLLVYYVCTLSSLSFLYIDCHRIGISAWLIRGRHKGLELYFAWCDVNIVNFHRHYYQCCNLI